MNVRFPTKEELKDKAWAVFLPLLFLSAVLLLWCSTRVEEAPPPAAPAHPVFANTTAGAASALAAEDEIAQGAIPVLTEEDIRALLKQRQDASRFTVQADASGSIRPGTRELSLTVANPAVNTADCYFELVLGEETVYKSALLKPDSYMEKQTLDRELPAGQSSLLVRYHILLGEKEIGRIEVETSVSCK